MGRDTSNSYRLRWQRASHRAVGEFLATATELGLPAVMWTIATTGAITGEIDSLTSTPAEVRAAFARWAGTLGAQGSERVDHSGAVHLYARFAWSKDAEVRGAIRATIDPALDEIGAS